MSLEALRAQVEADETKQESEPETDLLDVVEESEQAEEAAEVAEESDDFELELAGEPEPQQQKPSAEEALIHKLTKERKKAKAVKDENEDLKRRLEALESRTAQPIAAPVTSAREPTMPDMYDPGIDGDRAKYDAAVKKFLHDMTAYNNRHSEADDAQAKYKQRVEGMTKNLAIRAAKFATENKVNVDRVATALERATDEIDAHVNIPGALAYLLDSVGDGSERIAYYIGTNESALSKVKALLKEDPNGLKAIAHMTRLATELKPKTRKEISNAPEPDQSLKGDKVGSATAKKIQELWDKAKSPDEMMKIRKRARELGVELKN